MRHKAQKTMNKNKITKGSGNLRSSRDKGVTSSDWLEDRTTLIWLGYDKSIISDYKDCQMSRCAPDFNVLFLNVTLNSSEKNRK